MDVVELAHLYQAKTDEEILQLAGQAEQLTAEARAVLAGELTRRRLTPSEEISPAPGYRRPATRELRTHQGGPQPTAEFIAEVLALYRDHFWLFVKIIFPAVAIGTLAVITSRYLGREIARDLPRGYELPRLRIKLFEVTATNASGWFLSWIAFSFSFAAICAAVRDIGRGTVPSVRQSFAVVGGRVISFLRLSTSLLLILLLAEVAGEIVHEGVVWLLRRASIPVSTFTTWLVIFICLGLAWLVCCRFALAMPALILDDYPVGKALFRSDELTERKWLTLAVLLSKSLVGGYIVGMMPFWLARFIPADISLPSWFPWVLTVASVGGVTLVEPIMFVGFALMYVKAPATSPTSTQTQAAAI